MKCRITSDSIIATKCPPYLASEGDLHWNENVATLTKFSPAAASEVVKTTSSAASNKNFVKI